MDKIELSASPRETLGKKVRFLRRQGITPANLYGHKVQSQPLQVDTIDLKNTLARAGKSSLVSLKVDGWKRTRTVIFRDVQREPLTGSILHVDLYQVKMEEKIRLDVPLVFINEAPAVKDRGGILVQNMNTIEVECLPANMPHQVEVDLSVLEEIDQAVHIKDLSVEDGITIITDPEQSIVQIARSRVEVEILEEALAAEEEAAAAEAEAEVEAEAEAEVEEAKAEEAPEGGEETSED